MTDTLLSLLVWTAFIAFAAKRTMTYLHILQQDDYDHLRLLKWIISNRVFDKKLSLALVVIGGIWLFAPQAVTALLLAGAFGFFAYQEADPRTASKKKLVFTQRVQRIFAVAMVFCALAGLRVAGTPLPWLWIVAVQAVPFLLVLANIALIPAEASIQKKLWAEAQKRLSAVQPKVIGITGSFGKTSVKHILGHILKSHAPTLVTPGSVNTPMGIVRIAREQLEDHHKFFVVEMGAYGPGSIARLCRLTPPDTGIITAIGHAHYERFKTLETVAAAKYELAQAAAARGGNMIVHDSTLRFPAAAQARDAHRSAFTVVGGDRDVCDLFIARNIQTPEGLEVEVVMGGETYALQAPLYGLHHGVNIALAFAAALKLGLPAETIRTALKSTPQIAHRLEVKKQGDGSTIIDDAFNSNPRGFASALELLGAMGKQGRKILITPGMVELGAAHNEEHRKIGRMAGEICDVIIAVNPARIHAFVWAAKDSGQGKEILEVSSFAEAAKWLDANRKAGDVILIENDLPDLYERIPKI